MLAGRRAPLYATARFAARDGVSAGWAGANASVIGPVAEPASTHLTVTHAASGVSDDCDVEYIPILAEMRR